MANALNAVWGSPSEPLSTAFVISAGVTLTSTDLGTQYNGIGNTWIQMTADTITAIGYHQGTTTGTPAGGSYSVAVYPLTTGGLINSGATFANATTGGVTVTTFTPAAANDNTWVWVSLAGNTYALSAGVEYGVAMWRNAATDASNKITANGSFTNFTGVGYPVSETCAAGTWTKSAGGNTATMGLQSASTAFGLPYTGTTIGTASTFGSTTETGFSFTIPTDFCSTFTVKGIRGVFKVPASSATNTLQANLYSSIGSSPVQQQKTALILNDRAQGFSTTIRTVAMTFQGTLATLTAGVKYGIGFSTTTAADGSMYSLTMAAAADFNAWDYQQNTAFMTRTASSFANINAGTATGNFTETTTVRPWVSLILGSITAATGSSGMLYIPDMAGT